jgi:sulfopyruvate decarboxylase TPP-binding subunit
MKKDLSNKIIEALEFSDIEYLITVPTSGMEKIYQTFEKKDKCIYVTREEEGAALASGLTLGARRSILFIQQTGVGNMLNFLFSFAEVYNVYFPILVMDRGEHDVNPVHHNSSRKTKKILMNEEAVTVNWKTKESILQFKDWIDQNKRWFYSEY